MLRYAPSAAAVWQCDRVRAMCGSNSGRHKVFFKALGSAPLGVLWQSHPNSIIWECQYEIIFGIQMGEIREARLPSLFPKTYQTTAAICCFCLFHSSRMRWLGAARLPIRFPPQHELWLLIVSNLFCCFTKSYSRTVYLFCFKWFRYQLLSMSIDNQRNRAPICCFTSS